MKKKYFRSATSTSSEQDRQQRSLEEARIFRGRYHISTDENNPSTSDVQHNDEVIDELISTQERRTSRTLSESSLESTEPVSQQVSQLSVSSEGLPVGWSMQVAPNGRVFYIDHNTKSTAWVRIIV